MLLLPIIFILSGIFLLVLFVQRKALLDMIPQEISDKFISNDDDVEEETEELDEEDEASVNTEMNKSGDL